jgi:hypothetical protein
VSLLSGARNEKNGPLAKEQSRIIQQLFPELKDSLTSASVLLANTLGSSGAFNEASDVRWTLNQSGSKKKIGLTWTAVNGEIVVNNDILRFTRTFPRNFTRMINRIRGVRKSMRNSIDSSPT